MRTLAITLLPLALASCLRLEVGASHEPDTDFAAYSSFALQPRTTPPTLLEGYVESEVVRGLEAKSLVENDPGTADLLVTYWLRIDRRYGASAVPTRGPFKTHAGTFHDETYDETTLVVDFIERRSGRIVWRGWAAGFVGGVEAARTVPEVVRRILEGYPPTTDTTAHTAKKP
jgi:hypothetical protein